MPNVTPLSQSSQSADRIAAGAAKGARYGHWVLGNKAFERRDFGAALDAYQKAAAAGFPLAHRALGYIVANGIGIAADPIAAAGHYVTAADAGNGPAAMQAGLCYLFGKGVEADRLRAVHYFGKAADGGVAMAKTQLALASLDVLPLESAGQTLLRLVAMSRETDDPEIHHAIGVAWLEGFPGWVDLERAESAFHYAAGLGHLQSKLELARLKLGWVVDRDVNGAIRLLLDAAKGGVADAAAELASIFLAGSYGLPQEIDYGLDWLMKSIDGGSIAGKITFAKFLMGSGEKRDLKQASDLVVPATCQVGSVEAAAVLSCLLERAPEMFGGDQYIELLTVCAEAGCIDAMTLLAKDVVDADLRMFWLQVAVDEGSIFAQFALGCELWNMGKKRSSIEALAYLKSASRLGSIEATRTLADFYYEGSRVKRDLKAAAHYLAILADGGDDDARVTLASLQAQGIVAAELPTGDAAVVPINATVRRLV